MARSLYGAYTAAGSAGAELTEKKQDILSVGYKSQFHGEKHKMEMESLQETIGSITEGIALADTLYGGYQSKKKYGEAQTEVQTGMAKEAYGKSEVGKAEGATKWGDLGEEGQSEWMKKFAPSEKPQAWHEKLFGVEKEYRFGEKVEGKEGKDLSEYYSKSDILAKGTLSKTTRLGKKSGIDDKLPSFNLNEEFGGLEDKSKVITGGEKSLADKSIESTGARETSSQVMSDVSSSFGSNFLDPPDYGPSRNEGDKMSKMMEIYKNKPKGGWNPEKEDWYDPTRASEYGWTGKSWQ